MALLPTIPTSFVPKTSSFATARRPVSLDFVSSLSVLSYILLGLALAVAIILFIYGRILTSQHASKTAALEAAQAGIDTSTVASFIRLRDRLNSGGKLLDQHVELSNFFALIETLTPSSVRFSTMHFSLGADRKPLLQAAGTASNFNALAATSNAIGADGRLKDAIFSNIAVTQTGSVNFTLTTMLDPTLLVYRAAVPSAAPQEDAGTTTPTTL